MARALDQILKAEKPEIVAAARGKADAMLLGIQLNKYRTMMEKSQGELRLMSAERREIAPEGEGNGKI